MGFFDETKPPPPRPPRVTPPPWAGPPPNHLGAAVPIRAVLARTPEVVIAMVQVVAYPTGFECQLRLVARESGLDQAGLRSIHMGGSGDLQFGLEYSDGRRAATGTLQRPQVAPDPAYPVVTPRGGGGGQHEYHQVYWVWPLPPPGRLRLHCRWLSGGVPESSADIDAGPIVEAAERSEPLWPDPPGSGPLH